MFEITITETTHPVMRTKEYKVVGTEEVEREHRFYGNDKAEPKTRLVDVYDYVETDQPVEKKREVLKQTVAELDLAAVIKAINKL